VRDDRPAGSAEPPAVLFRYSPDRKGERPRAHLASFVGVLQADAYAGFDQLYGEKIKEAACWAHVRRKFYDIHVALSSPIALEALERIGRLYKVEEEIRGRQPHERHSVRQACVIHAMSVHGFSACRSSISRHAGHRFQTMSVHRFTACRSSS
jgi:hypothetical protein